jgi:ribonuclease-3
MSTPAAPLRLTHAFRQPALLAQALTHKSFGSAHNERLEFLGDAVLNLAVSALLYRQFPDVDEGELTRVRAHLVRQDSLHRIALQLGLPAALKLSEGEARSGGAQRPSILADAVEAILGAIFLDGGWEPALATATQWFTPLVTQTQPGQWAKDAKTQLQEWLQARQLPVPQYRIDAVSGKAHDQSFVVSCRVDAYDVEASGQGRSRRAAEQAAAQRVLERLTAGEQPT